MKHRLSRGVAALLAVAACAAMADDSHRHGPYGDYDVIHSFDSTSATGGSLPYGGLALANDGSVYGDTTIVSDAGSPVQVGGLFQLGRKGTVSLVQTTGPRPVCVIGARDGGLFLTYIKDPYLTDPDAWGYIVHQTSSGARRTLHHFSATDPAGYYPQPRLVEGADGSLYGATEYGGASGYGTIFRIAPDGSVVPLTPLQPFGVAAPSGDLVGTPTSDGNLYVPGWGGIFRIAPDGTTTMTGVFDGPTTGDSPPGPLVSGPDGALYGTSTYGGPGAYGTVFRYDPASGAVTALHSFGNGPNRPNSSLTLAADGYLYGTLSTGGAGHEGGIFRIRPDGSDYAFVVAFVAPGDGYHGGNPLLALPDGRLVGTRLDGGTSGQGSIFVLAPKPAARAN